MKNRIIFWVGVLLLGLALLGLSPVVLLAQVPQNIQKLSGNLTQDFNVPSGIDITASGTGTIQATSVTGLSVAAGKTLTASNTLTFTGTDGSSVAFGTGGTVLYSGGSYAASITGTANQIAASASTGAVTLSLAGPHNFTSLTSGSLLLGAGSSPISASDLSYTSPTLTVPDAFSLTSAGSIALTAGGTNENITITPSGTGEIYLAGKFKATLSADTKVINSDTALRASRWNNGATARAQFGLQRYRGTEGTPLTVVDGDSLGAITVQGYDGAALQQAAGIEFLVDGAISGGAVPTAIAFQTGSAAGNRTTRLTIASAGAVVLPSTNTAGLQLYNTSDQVTNFERLEALWSEDVLWIRSTAGGTGTLRTFRIGAFTSGGSFNTLAFANAELTAPDITRFTFAPSGSYAATSGASVCLLVAPRYNQTSGTAANTDLLINRTETAVGSGPQYWTDLQVGSVSRLASGSSKVTTTSATVTTVQTYTVPASTTWGFDGYVVARRTGGSAGTAEDGAYYRVEGAVKNVAGTATLIGSPAVTVIGEDQAGWDVTVDVTGATVRIRVTGAADNNISWVWTGNVRQVSS